MCSQNRVLVCIVFGLMMLLPGMSFADGLRIPFCSLVGSYNYIVTEPGNVTAYGVNSFTASGTVVSQGTANVNQVPPSTNVGEIFTGVWIPTGINRFKVVLDRIDFSVPAFRIRLVENFTMDSTCQNITGTGVVYYDPNPADLTLSEAFQVGTESLTLARINAN